MDMETETLLPKPRFHRLQNMETETLLPKPSSGIMKMNRRPMRYQRLGGLSSGSPVKVGKKLTKMVRLKGTNSRRYWRIKAIPKLSLVVRSPLKLLAKLKNAYIDFMLRLSGKIGGGLSDGINMFGQRRIPKARQVTEKFSMNELEARLIYEISKILVASRELNPM